MIIGILKETKPSEKRVSAVPDSVEKYGASGLRVWVQQGAGKGCGYTDEDYRAFGAEIVSRHELFEKADILSGIWGIDPTEYHALRPNVMLTADFETGRYPERIPLLAARQVTAIALEKMPRLSRAQSMDILSSQNNLAGYKAALTAMSLLKRSVPMMMTAAGTVMPSRALILGAGVAGLQALATLKRAGAVVYASDVRQAAKEQIESLGGKFLTVDEKADFATTDGYAAEQTADYRLKQQAKIRERLRQTDILITTAVSATGKAPVLVTADMLTEMPRDSVIADLAGGNVETDPLFRKDLIVIQKTDFAADIPLTASRLFAENVLNFIRAFGGAKFSSRREDEILKAVCLCSEGVVRKG